MIGGVTTAAAVRTWPFRIYSFPSELRFLSIDELKRIYVERALTSLLAEARGQYYGLPSGWYELSNGSQLIGRSSSWSFKSAGQMPNRGPGNGKTLHGFIEQK